MLLRVEEIVALPLIIEDQVQKTLRSFKERKVLRTKPKYINLNQPPVEFWAWIKKLLAMRRECERTPKKDTNLFNYRCVVLHKENHWYTIAVHTFLNK